MKHAIYAPNFNDYGDPALLVELAQASEEAGYDGFFIWDHLAFAANGQLDVVDATVVLGALAQATQRIRLGAMVTPLARRRPWKLARELVTLDHLSNGRVTLGVGLGEPADLEFAAFGENPDARVRAARLDEGLQLFAALTGGDSVTHEGTYYSVTDTRFSPPALQQPRIPVWVAASLPARAGLRRAARWDGVFPLRLPAEFSADAKAAVDWSKWWLSVADFADVIDYVARHREPGKPFDAVASGRLGRTLPIGEGCADFAAVGASWWCWWVPEAVGTFAATLATVKLGPPS